MFTFIQSWKFKKATLSALHIEAVRWNHRKIPLSRGRHVTGHYSPGPDRPSIPFESHTECRAIDFLMRMSGVSMILSQPFTVEYHEGGRRRSYTPDLLVIGERVTTTMLRHGFGALTIVEVKATIDSWSRAVLAYKLQIITHATGLPTLLALPTNVGLGNGNQEVEHAS